MEEDYYQILGVDRKATADEIQKAYRTLARKYHPDLNPDDKTAKAKFQKVQAAFDVLNDSTKRDLYDRYGSNFEAMGAGGGPRGGGPGMGGAPFENFDFSQIFGGEGPGHFGNLFEQMRGGQGRSRGGGNRPRQGSDIESEITIMFSTAILGGEVQISVRTADGQTKTLDVKIPPGVEDGKKIRLRGQGEPAPRRGMAAGDLILTVRIANHPHFKRQGNNLLLTVPVTLAEAALGGKVDIPTPQGTIALRVPPGTSSGTKLRVKGRGVPVKDGDPGDLFAEVQIIIPKQIDATAQKLIEQLAAEWTVAGQPDPRRELRW